jgi:hypothetical protein
MIFPPEKFICLFVYFLFFVSAVTTFNIFPLIKGACSSPLCVYIIPFYPLFVKGEKKRPKSSAAEYGYLGYPKSS